MRSSFFLSETLFNSTPRLFSNNLLTLFEGAKKYDAVEAAQLAVSLLKQHGEKYLHSPEEMKPSMCLELNAICISNISHFRYETVCNV
jgi:hypothetical protein